MKNTAPMTRVRKRIRFTSLVFGLGCQLSIALPTVAWGAPIKPTDPSQVLEVLPTRLATQSETEIRRLRDRLNARPDDAGSAAELAENYYRIAQRQGDPRYIGYAQAVLAPWQGISSPPADIRLARALLAQFMHDFPAARSDLDAVLAADPNHLAALSYRAVLNLVSARYAAARDDCATLERSGRALIIDACRPTVDALTGKADAAYRSLQASLRTHADAPPNERLWVLTRLAEIALRLGRTAQADAHFREALAVGITDQYLLAIYAEFLLDQNRNSAVIQMLSTHVANDVLLLRLALAEQASGHPDTNAHTALLRQRFEANRRRGDTTHLADEAIFELRFNKNPHRALALASENWGIDQREPSDARIVLESALAAGRRGEAEPIRQWLEESGQEDVRLKDLANQVFGGKPENTSR